jgi:hypothetical protein
MQASPRRAAARVRAFIMVGWWGVWWLGGGLRRVVPVWVVGGGGQSGCGDQGRSSDPKGPPRNGFLPALRRDLMTPPVVVEGRRHFDPRTGQTRVHAPVPAGVDACCARTLKIKGQSSIPNASRGGRKGGAGGACDG